MTMPPFLRATDVMDFEHPAVAALAREVAAGRGAGHDAAIAADCFAWVRDRIPHTVDLGGGPVPCAASEVLAAGTGFCFAKSHLLAALLHANGIPAALCYQRLSIDDSGPPFTLHGMVAVLLPDHGWYRCDPRGDKPGLRTAFTPPVEALAYQPKLPGEGDVPGLHADPLPQVLRALRGANTCAELLAILPDV
ncbi:transglutaminase-like domain-containing protein [Novispirillum sp. DQ9]|uniref:transglutaminase-like domain-containing protein n=1 Tax=Novispirillum sp. DQ9 TaxID=3398612 RepID=UPI003C7B5EE0